MAESRRIRSLLVILCIFFYGSSVSSTLSPSICLINGRSPPAFIGSLRAECPLSFFPNSLLEVNGDYLEKNLMSMEENMYASVLFYGSWCPFSHDARLTFEGLSSMFPQIPHFAVEQSAAMPSLFSRYGIHSLPAILLVANQTSRERFYGSKDIHSLVRFYQKITGFEPARCVDADQYAMCTASSEKLAKPLWVGSSSFYDVLKGEPYLLLSVLFICMRVSVGAFPIIMSHLRAFWARYAPQLKLEIFGETSQLLGRALNMIDVKRVWAKLRFCKIRNFQEGAKNARVWASSLASVSLGGEASSSRSASS